MFFNRKPQGFTLIELTVVLIIMVLGFAVIGIKLSSGNESSQLKAAARDVVSAMRFARGQALSLHQEAIIAIDLSDNSYTVTGREQVYTIPEDVEVTVDTAQEELSDGVANVRFFADGSSTGGRVTLELGKYKWQIDVNWLTGQVELNDRA